jgi:hypothetical protein
LIATTGQSWEQVRNDWDLPRLKAWSEYCRTHPTLRTMVQAYLGIEVKVAEAPGTPNELLATLAEWPGAAQL